MKKTILLVDDEKYILKSLERLLGLEDYRILTAQSGLEGLELLKQHKVHVVVTDQRMPIMKGVEFLKQVKATYPNTVRIVVSAYEDFDTIKEIINEGSIYKFISKPWDDELFSQVIRDALEFYNTEKQFREMISISNTDQLTHLSNRFGFFDVLEKTLASNKNKPLALIYLDLDRFSNINLAIGHRNGDQLLQLMSKNLNAFLQDEHQLARLGNDEFAILITEEETLSNLTTFMEKLTAAIRLPIVINNKTLYVTGSMGVSLYPEHGRNVDLLIECAQISLYSCQEMGGDHYLIYEAPMYNYYTDEMILKTELHQAIENNEFIIYYQPIYTIDTEQIVGLEALVRWQHPNKGLVQPGSFLPLCEETNLIIPIGEWIMRNACQELKKWHERGHTNLYIAINLSSRQLNHPGLLNFVIDILKDTQLPPKCLEFEITEQEIGKNIEKAISILKSLQELGISLALDDFGTGYLSLNYLQKFPFTTLKISRTLIHDMLKTTYAEALIDTIIVMGKTLHLKLIAVGLETEAQLNILRKKQCKFVQGYLFTKPKPHKNLKDLC